MRPCILGHHTYQLQMSFDSASTEKSFGSRRKPRLIPKSTLIYFVSAHLIKVVFIWLNRACIYCRPVIIVIVNKTLQINWGVPCLAEMMSKVKSYLFPSCHFSTMLLAGIFIYIGKHLINDDVVTIGIWMDTPTSLR